MMIIHIILIILIDSYSYNVVACCSTFTQDIAVSLPVSLLSSHISILSIEILHIRNSSAIIIIIIIIIISFIKYG